MMLQAAPQVSAIAAMLMGQFQVAGFDVSNTNGLGQVIKSSLISASIPLRPTSGKSIGGGLVSGAAAWSAVQKSQLYMQGPTRRPSNTTGTSSVTSAVVYILIGFAIASIVFAILLAVLHRYRQRPPKPVDLVGVNFRSAQIGGGGREAGV